MATLVVATFVTLDGVMQGPGGPDEDRSGGFTDGGWSVGYWDEAMGKIITEWTAQADALLLGRTIYEIFAEHWPHVPDDDPVGAVLNRVPKHVASTTLKTVEWNNSTLLRRGHQPIPSCRRHQIRLVRRRRARRSRGALDERRRALIECSSSSRLRLPR
jgi:dihydrofolate reductase